MNLLVQSIVNASAALHVATGAERTKKGHRNPIYSYGQHVFDSLHRQDFRPFFYGVKTAEYLTLPMLRSFVPGQKYIRPREQ